MWVRREKRKKKNDKQLITLYNSVSEKGPSVDE